MTFDNASSYSVGLGDQVVFEAYLSPASWRAFSRDEMLDFLDRPKSKTAQVGPKSKKKKAQKKAGKRQKRLLFLGAQRSQRNHMIVLQKSISPFDAYTYLFARFGEPNGMMTFLAKNDSDNLFHWDYYLKAGEKNLGLLGQPRKCTFILMTSLAMRSG